MSTRIIVYFEKNKDRFDTGFGLKIINNINEKLRAY